jgi:predicted lipid-binding transport protein (Tim44 family)
MKTKTNQNQIVINTDPKNEKKMLPRDMMFTLAAGAIAGMAMIFTLFWGVEKLLGM